MPALFWRGKNHQVHVAAAILDLVLSLPQNVMPDLKPKIHHSHGWRLFSS
jgi:hypothetical protein